MASLRGRAPRGARPPGHHPHGHWRTLTFLAALRSDRIDAPGPFNAPVNRPINVGSFTAQVRQAPVPTLSPGDGVVPESLGGLFLAALGAAIGAAGAQILFLRPCSPDPSPVEQVLAKLRHDLCEATGRTINAVTEALTAIPDRFTPPKSADCVANAGCASS